MILVDICLVLFPGGLLDDYLYSQPGIISTATKSSTYLLFLCTNHLPSIRPVVGYYQKFVVDSNIDLFLHSTLEKFGASIHHNGMHEGPL